MDGPPRGMTAALATRRSAIAAVAAALALGTPRPAPARRRRCTACCGRKPGHVAQLQILHADPGAPPLDVRVDGVLGAAALAFGEVTALSAVDAGNRRIVAVPAGADPGEPALEQVVALHPCRSYLFAIDGPGAGTAGEADAPAGILLEQDRGRLVGDIATRVAAVHLAPGLPAVDVWLERPAAAGRGYDRLPVGMYLECGHQAEVVVQAGEYDLAVYLAATGTEALRVRARRYAARELAQIAIVGPADAPAGVTIVNPTCCGDYVPD